MEKLAFTLRLQKEKKNAYNTLVYRFLISILKTMIRNASKQVLQFHSTAVICICTAVPRQAPVLTLYLLIVAV